MAEMIQYKCPNCGAGVSFSGSEQKMRCPYCESEFTMKEASVFASHSGSVESESESWAESADHVEVEEAPVFHGEIHADSTGNSWNGSEDSKFGIYTCSSCGAELICDDTTAATRCPYCDNNVILKGRLSGELKPDLILPFQVTREQAVHALTEHFKGKKLLPKVFTSEDHIDEIKGVYVPFWIYDTTADASAEYAMTKVRTWSDRNYVYTETSHFQASRAGTLDFVAVPVDGLEEIANDLTESLETFDVSKAVPFQPEYLSGYYANRYDVDSDSAIGRATERITNSAVSALDETVTGYATITRKSGSTRLIGTKVKYALFPIWILNTTWRGKNYLFAMNGESGKFVGNLPINNRKYWLMRLLYSVLFGGAIYGGLHYFGFF